MQECDFCKKVKFWKENTEQCRFGCMLHMRPENATGSVTTSPYKINYCPVCGKKIAAGD